MLFLFNLSRNKNEKEKFKLYNYIYNYFLNVFMADYSNNNISTETWKVTITDGYYKGNLIGNSYEIRGGYFVNKPKEIKNTGQNGMKKKYHLLLMNI